MNRLDLAALEAFAAIARHRNFRRAAVERGVSASTLSQSLRVLEQRLGVRLLNRTTRSVAPTEAGERLLARLTPALSDIANAVDEALATQTSVIGTLRINAPAPAVDLVLAPLVAGFLERHPGVRLEITAETALVDIVAQGFDAGVRWGESLAKDMIATPLGSPERFQVVASPQVLARFGTPEHPRDLLNLPCLRQRFPSGAEPAWEFEREGVEVRIAPAGPLASTEPQLLLQAALDSVGFLTTFEAYARPHVQAGRLIAVLDEWCPEFPGPFLYYPSRRHPPPALKAFVDFLKDGQRRRARA